MRGAYFVPRESWAEARAAGIDLVHWHGVSPIPGLMAAWYDVRTGEPVMTYAVDEPDLQGMPSDVARAECERFRLPGIPTFAVVFSDYVGYRDIADIIGVDIYPYNRWHLFEPWNIFSWFTLLQGRWQLWRARRALAGRRWYGIIQAFADNAGGHRMPTVAEFRWWERAFLQAGAEGVMAFAWSWPGGIRGAELIRAAWGGDRP